METVKYPLTLDGDTFGAFKSDFDQILNALINEMENREEEDATISIKISVSLHPDQERDFETNGYDGMKDIIKPVFKHDISSVMQVKQKKSGILGGNMKMVWDKELRHYVLQRIDNGQTSLFDQKPEPQQPKSLPSAESGQIVDVPYEEITDEYTYDEPTDEADE